MKKTSKMIKRKGVKHITQGCSKGGSRGARDYIIKLNTAWKLTRQSGEYPPLKNPDYVPVHLFVE